MRIAWVVFCPSHVEEDIARSALDVRFFIASSFESVDTRVELLEAIARYDADLYVFRYPAWLVEGGDVVRETFARLFSSRPALAWMSEQGPTLTHAINSAAWFSRIAVNNRQDFTAYRYARPDARLFYLPFGCTAYNDVARDERFAFDMISDGDCHYACSDEGGAKRRSVEQMIVPLLNDPRLALWGIGHCPHGWLGVPGADRRYQGYYFSVSMPRVYASAKLYVGISWNTEFGGYGIKLARVLASGLPVLWPRTAGMQLDGLVPGTHLLTSSSPSETREVVSRALAWIDETHLIGLAGQRFALSEWDWRRNLERLCDEVGRS